MTTTTLAAGLFDPAQITVLFLSFAVLLGLARLLGEIARYYKQPTILGEILAGVILGKTVLGSLNEDLFNFLFSQKAVVDGVEMVRPEMFALEGLFVISAALLLLIAGLEVELSTVWRQGKAALSVSFASMVIPFAVGFPLAWYAPQFIGMGDVDPEMRLAFSLFMGIALSITALPVIAKILMDLNLNKSDFGTIVISSAMLNDLIGWMGFALVLAMISPDIDGAGGVVKTIVLTLSFMVPMIAFGGWAFNRILPWIQAHASWPGGVLGTVMVCALFGAAYTEWIGIHAIFGAFIVGIAVGNSRHLTQQTRETIHQFINNIFAPLFFASIGLYVNFLEAFDLTAVVVVLVVAIIGKVVGSYAGAKIAGMNNRDSAAIGFAMCARGAMEIILGQLALSAGLINDELFVAIVIMAIITSLMSGPAIERLLQRKQQSKLSDILTDQHYIPRLEARTAKEAIHVLSERAATLCDLDAQTIEEAVWKREMIVRTGIGQGIAVPHARLEGLSKPMVIVGRDYEGLDFDAPDGRPAVLVNLLLTPAEDLDAQIELLAMVSQSFSDAAVRERVMEAESYTEFLAALNLAASQQEHG